MTDLIARLRHESAAARLEAAPEAADALESAQRSRDILRGNAERWEKLALRYKRELEAAQDDLTTEKRRVESRERELEAAQAEIERLRKRVDGRNYYIAKLQAVVDWFAERSPDDYEKALAATGEDNDRGTFPHQNGEKA